MKTTSRLFLVFATLIWISCAGEPGAERTAGPAGAGASDAVAPETEEQKLLYMMGLATGERLTQMRLSEDELHYVLAGIRDRALERPAAVDEMQYAPRLGAYAQQRVQQAAAMEPELAAEFLAAQAAQSGAEVTPSGMIYFELTPGDGDSPGEDATVVVHYVGKLRNGAVFDSSYVRGEPAVVSLAQQGDQQVIPCWSEGVQRMKVGGKSRFVCPPETAYGAAGAPPKILPGAALLFEIELLELKATEVKATD